MLLRFLMASPMLLAPSDGGPGGGGGAPAPVLTPPTPPPAPAPGVQPFATFTTQDQFTERVQREARSLMRTQLGVEPEEAAANLTRLKELEAAQQERDRANMTELERLRTDLAAANARADEAAAERDEVRFRGHVAGIAAKMGIRNVDYAIFVAAGAAEALPDGQQLDVEQHFTGLLEQANYKGAFGIEAAPVPVPVPVTSAPAPGAPPAAPPVPGAEPPKKDAMSMSSEEFRTHKATLGL